MKNTYGYNPLSYELIELLRSGAPDFGLAEELIRRGADINDQGDDKDENVLSEILEGYECIRQDALSEKDDVCDDCDNNGQECFPCKYNKKTQPNVGKDMVKIIRFFLNHGFDVTKCNGKYGMSCLSALVFSAADRYMIEAIKIIFDAYGSNKPKWREDDDEAPLAVLKTECGYLYSCMLNPYRGNIYETACQVYYALKENRSYEGIQTCEAAIGMKILRVMADETNVKNVFSSMTRSDFKSDHCFRCRLYLMFEGGYLIYSPDASCWVDSTMPEKPLVDVSAYFEPIINKTIRQILFDYHSTDEWANYYELPVNHGDTTISITFDSDIKINFSYKFIEVPRKASCSYFYYGNYEPQK